MTSRRWVQPARDLVLNAVGGGGQARVVLLLAAVLGLNGADTATISATTGDLERAFHVGNTQIGLLLSVVALTGAVFTVPAGILTDRTKRTRLLAISITGLVGGDAVLRRRAILSVAAAGPGRPGYGGRRGRAHCRLPDRGLLSGW
jgi:MFS family permease